MKTTDVGTRRLADFESIERVERRAFLDCFKAAPADVVARFGVDSRGSDPLALLAARQVPLVEFNRVVGLGIESPAVEAQLDSALDWAADHCHPSFAVQVAPSAAPSAVSEWLSARGFRPDGNGWAKFRRGPAPVVEHPTATAIRIREAGPADAGAFGEVCMAAFGLDPGLAPWFSAMVGRPRVRAYLAFDGATPVGTGLLFAEDGWAWLGCGATLPGRRGRGAQSALLARRLADGLAMGVKGFTIETYNPASPDAPEAASYRNILRAGFEVAYVRPNYSRRAEAIG